MTASRLLRRYGAEAAGAIGALAAALVVTAAGFGRGFPLDDAWIHMVYGLALREHGELAYDDGHPSTGCTSPGWAALIALAHVLARAHGPSLGAAAVVQGLGFAVHSLEAALAARLTARLAPSRRSSVPLAIAAGVLVACTPVLAFAAGSGMEVPLEGTLLLATLLAARRRAWVVAGASAALASVVRPEGALAVVAATALALSLDGWGAALRSLGAGSLGPLAFAARDLLVSGRALPATFYVKANPGVQPLAAMLSRGMIDAFASMAPGAHGALLVALLPAIACGVRAGRSPRRAPRCTVIAVAALLGLAYVAGLSALTFLENPRSFYYQRYLAPALPPLIVAALGGLGWSCRVAATRWRALRGATACLTLTMVLAAVGLEIADMPRARRTFASDLASTNAQQVTIGRWIAANTRPGAVVWTIDAGAVRYWGRRVTVDLIRLNTPELFEGVRILPGYDPDIIAIIPALFQLATQKPILDVALAVESATGQEAWRQEVHACRERGRVIVLYDRQRVVADGTCAP